MPTEFESIIRQVTADYRASRGLPPLASDMTVPASIRKAEPEMVRVTTYEPAHLFVIVPRFKGDNR